MVEILAPHLALGDASSIEVFAHTDSGRAARAKDAASKEGAPPFDIDAPGTLRLVGQIGSPLRVMTLQRDGYVSSGIAGRGNSYEQIATSRREGRFRVVVPLIPGVLPEQSFADPEAIREQRISYPYGLVAKAGERIHLGVAYTDRDGKRQWVTASAKVVSHPMLDVLHEDYRRTMSKVYVGERVHLRVVDPARDRTPGRDELRVYMASKSGAKHHVTLRETAASTGIFKGTYQLTYAASKDAAAEPGDAEEYDVKRFGFPVVYGDSVGVRYTDASGEKSPVHFITIGKGSDGSIAPFSKQYDDSETAMHTQFAMAESFLELARRHRKTGEEEHAQREFARAKQLLANAITQFNDPETRAHAEYLLGNLTMEDAEATDDGELQGDRYRAALARFMKVTGTYPDTDYASKAQFKVAVIYERLKEPDIAAQEYVKLAYKYPESEHLATAMARLGTHFQRKALGFEKQAEPLLAKEDDKDAQYEGTALQKLARLEYIKSAQIFERLQTRFPDNDLAGKAGLRAGQIYMRAEDYRSAVKALAKRDRQRELRRRDASQRSDVLGGPLLSIAEPAASGVRAVQTHHLRLPRKQVGGLLARAAVDRADAGARSQARNRATGGGAMTSRVMVIVLLVVAVGRVASASPLDDRIAAFNDAAEVQTEAAVSEVLRLGVAEHRSAEAMATVQAWLNRNVLTTQAAKHHAGQAAEYSGQWLVAVGYYQSLLQSPKLDAKLAGSAVDATYRLLVNVIGDPNAAYLFMRKDGNRLRAISGEPSDTTAGSWIWRNSGAT